MPDRRGAIRIALDVDGVLADVMQAWLAMTNPGRLAPLAKSDMSRWDFWARRNIRKRDFYAQLDACWKSWESIPPTEPGLAESVRLLSGMGAVDIVTARTPDTNRYVRLWLGEFGIAYDGYVQVAAGRMKADLDYDVFIDDSPVNAEAFLRNGKRVMLYEQPWNADTREADLLVRVSSIAQAAKAIGSLGS